MVEILQKCALIKIKRIAFADIKNLLSYHHRAIMIMTQNHFQCTRQPVIYIHVPINVLTVSTPSLPRSRCEILR